MKKFYAVLPKNIEANDMRVVQLGATKKQAILLYEHWQNNKDFKLTNLLMEEYGLEIRKIEIKEI